MEKESSFTLTISDLIQRAQPLTAAASLVPSRPISTLGPHNNSDENHRRKSSSDTCRNTGLQTLKPLNQPTPLIGTLTLPSIPKSSSRIKCNCFQFSDDSATICCGILDFDPKMIDQRIRVLAWNFIPLQCGDGGVKGGFLEIITWEFCRSFSGNVCSLSDFGSFCLTLGGCDVNENSAANCLMFGLIESISPVSVVPCAGGETGSRNISGFLANVRVCKCKICAAKLLVSQLKDLSEENVGDHSFTKTVIVYFCGLTSAWHPVISRFIGGIVLLTGLKKKLVFISKEVSQLMYVTTDEASFHIAKLFKQRGFVCNSDVRGEGECGSYTGIVTGLYMQGMVVELDQDVILLLTEQHLTVPHCVRVGAIQGLMLEFCKHNLCSVGNEAHYGHLRLVSLTNQKKPLCCEGRSYVQSVKRVFHTEEIGVLVLGTLKVSLSSGKLQLVDATGYIDIMTDLPTTWDFDRIFEFQGDLAKLSNIFAEAIVLPWDLLVAGKYEDTVTNYVENITRPEKHRSNKRCKVEQACVDASNIGLNESMNRLRGQFTLKTCASNHPIELPCLIASKGKKIHYHAKMVSVCKPSKRKVLLEFSPDSLCVYEVMKIGCCYLIKHHEEDNLRPRKENPQISRAKLSISSENRVRKVRFSSIETLRNSDVFPSCNLHNSSDEIILEGPHRVEISGLDSDVHSDINVFVPSGDVTLLEKAIKDSSSEESDIHGHGEPMTNASVCHTLPEGNLITLQGVVMSFHDCSGDNCPVPGQGYLPMFLRGNGGVCFHVLVDNQTLRIFCDLSKQTYPVGLGTNVYATFHRILVLSAQNRYVMTPVSFITIKDTILTNGHLTDEFNDPSRTGTETVGLFSVASPNTVPTILISDALQLSELKPLKFRCRIVGVYTLVFEKTKTTAVSRSCFGIPFAGFIIDDGSSSCCCWVDSERAKALLGLEFEDHLRKDSAESFGRSKARKRSNIGRLNRVLERHNRIVVKNYGHIFDPSSQQLAFLVNSDKSLRSSDEDLLRNSINYAFLRPSWTIVGNLMDEKTSNWLGERLMELDILFPSLLNVWLTSICHTDMLAEARNIIQELV
ncbi:hypothetical protein MIMGU_mgv1a020802mg [Erythranthe guttata]|uniref:CST complex subunit CTC1 n=1 Tax=Erythranthe guttata TaxID=4155 RepID=A0A022QFT2_ERYGU|nr:hypothetical protein MIMGU_mgv1a020802mg [Erythranthe guttata]